MPTPLSSDDDPNSFSAKIRQIAAQQTDPLERKSLLETAAKVEATDAKVREALSSAQEDALRIKLEMDLLRRRNELPGWGVAVVFLAFALFLVYVAFKHHV